MISKCKCLVVVVVYASMNLTKAATQKFEFEVLNMGNITVVM